MDVPDMLGFSGPWVYAPGSFSATGALAELLSAPVAAPGSTAQPGPAAPSSSGPCDTRIVLYFAPGCDVHQMSGDDGLRARMDLLKMLMMKFLDAAHIGCKLDQEMLKRSVEGEVSLVDSAFVITGMLLDEVIVWRLGHLLLRLLSAHPVLLEDEGGNQYPVRFSGFGFMYL